jgi:hypothetical protein
MLPQQLGELALQCPLRAPAHVALHFTPAISRVMQWQRRQCLRDHARDGAELVSRQIAGMESTLRVGRKRDRGTHIHPIRQIATRSLARDLHAVLRISCRRLRGARKGTCSRGVFRALPRVAWNRWNRLAEKMTAYLFLGKIIIFQTVVINRNRWNRWNHVCVVGRRHFLMIVDPGLRYYGPPRPFGRRARAADRGCYSTSFSPFRIATETR